MKRSYPGGNRAWGSELNAEVINYPDLLSLLFWVFSNPEVIEQAKLNIFDSSA